MDYHKYDYEAALLWNVGSFFKMY